MGQRPSRRHVPFYRGYQLAISRLPCTWQPGINDVGWKYQASTSEVASRFTGAHDKPTVTKVGDDYCHHGKIIKKSARSLAFIGSLQSASTEWIIARYHRTWNINGRNNNILIWSLSNRLSSQSTSTKSSHIHDPGSVGQRCGWKELYWNTNSVPSSNWSSQHGQYHH